MLENEVLKMKLKSKLDKLGLSEEASDALVAELNFLSNFLIDANLNKNTKYGTDEK